MATTFHTAIFTREGTLGLTIAECETSAAAVVVGRGNRHAEVARDGTRRFY